VVRGHHQLRRKRGITQLSHVGGGQDLVENRLLVLAGNRIALPESDNHHRCGDNRQYDRRNTQRSRKVFSFEDFSHYYAS
jgi:hypothetical protein